ncbi:MAG TPA: thiamine pyrophosphate-binding protein [Candidatus Limnocylindria bacterium]|nr:thiamine pyrophosphate-binding protein [Candidatus Limnocylindria bacterium]
MRAALYWARHLKERGVRRIFGHPGTESIELLEAAREAGLEFVLTHHEATAAFAAAMTGRLTGVPGVCVTTAGPGATNVASGVAQAYMDRMPLLVVTGDHPHGPGQPRHQRLPPDLYSSISRGTIRLTAANVATELPQAFDRALQHPQGPVYMTFPSGEMIKDAAGTPEPRGASAARRVPDLGGAERMIAGARRPMMIAGLGLTNVCGEDAFMRAVTSLGTPVADTPQSRGCIPSDHELYVGTFATHRDAAVTDLANASDLVIAVGLDSVEFLKPWQLKPPVLALAEAEAGNDPAIPATTAIDGPLPAMLERLARVRPAGAWPRDEVAAYRTRFLGSLMPPNSDEGRGRMWPQTVVATLREILPDDGVVSVDVGSHKLLMVLQWPVRRPRTFLSSSGLSSMGTGVPFALAAKLAQPEHPVVAVIGDGGFLMYAGEMATLARLGVPVVIVVMADAALYSIKIKQVRRSYAPTGTEIVPEVGIADVARSFGLQAERVSSAAALAGALRRALGADRPTVVEALIDPAGYEHSQ